MMRGGQHIRQPFGCLFALPRLLAVAIQRGLQAFAQPDKGVGDEHKS